jgi:hypothetical protein
MKFIKKKKRKKKIKKQISYYLTYHKKYNDYLRITKKNKNPLNLFMDINWFEEYKNKRNWLNVEQKKFKGNIKYITDVMDACNIVDLARSPIGLLDYYSRLSKIVYSKLTDHRLVHDNDVYMYNIREFNMKIFKIFNFIEKKIKFNKNNNILFNRSIIIL